jgi:drug/metabolite transporter (DMT)-like permease
MERSGFPVALAPRALWRAELVLLGITIIWGTTFTAVKIGLQHASPFPFLLARFGLALGVLSLWVRPWQMGLDLSAWRAGMWLGLWLGLGFVLQTAGLIWTTASMSAFITGASAAFTPLLERLLGRGRPPGSAFVGLYLVLMGLYGLSLPRLHVGLQAAMGLSLLALGLLGIARSGGRPIAGALLLGFGLWLVLRAEMVRFGIGEWLTLISALVWAVYIVEMDRLSGRAPAGALAWMQLAMVGLLALFLLPWFPVRFSPEPELLMGLVYLALVATVLTTWLQTRFQRQTTPTRAALIFAAEPLVAALGAALWLGEQMGLHGWISGALIVWGMLIAMRSGPQNHSALPDVKGTKCEQIR